MKLSEAKKKQPNGTYAAVGIDDESKAAIIKFGKENNIPNLVKPDDLHATLLYSRKHLPNYEPAGKLDPPLVGTFANWEIFKTDPKGTGRLNCLVLRFICHSLTQRHKDLMKEHDATYDFDEYKPHFTLSYNVGHIDIEKLPKFERDIIITEEYGEDLTDA